MILSFLVSTILAFVVAFAVITLDRHDKFFEDKEGSKYWKSPGFWSRVLGKNLLAFSDTQLLTGLAIQFTAQLKHCEISIYHF